MAFTVRQNVKIIEGRTFTPGLYELIAGKKAGERYEGLEVGGTDQAAAAELEGRRHLHKRRQQLRERGLGRRRGAGAGVQPRRRLSSR